MIRFNRRERSASTAEGDQYRAQYAGVVEVDETYVGGRDQGKVRAPNPDTFLSDVVAYREVRGVSRTRKLSSIGQ